MLEGKMADAKEKITILGIGNILLQDEGFGVHVLDELKQTYSFPDNVELVDGGTLGPNLITYIKGTTRLIIIDAIEGDGIPGTVYRFTGRALLACGKQDISSLHQAGAGQLLEMLAIIDQPVDEVIVLGAQPAVLDLGLGLSEDIAAAVDEVERLVVDQLRSWSIEIAKNNYAVT
jgi:hydrogenase maturation protease